MENNNLKRKDIAKFGDKRLTEKMQDLIEQQNQVKKNREDLEPKRDLIRKKLDEAIENHEEKEETVLRKRFELYNDELKKLNERDKLLDEQIELISRALKNTAEGSFSKWNVIGSWFIGLTGLGLSGWGIWKSHRVFETGDMVDKSTKSLAEKINPFALYKLFAKK